MSDHSAIEWTDATFNPWWGCEAVSPGCAHCYAETLSNRYEGPGLWGAGHRFRFFGDKHWAEPLKWNRKAERDGVRRRVFCASMADVFEEREELEDHRLRLFGLIEETPFLDWQILTKRPEFARDWIGKLYHYINRRPGMWPLTPPENLWIGTSIENARHTWRADVLREIPAAVRFISAEPLLGSLYPKGARNALPTMHVPSPASSSGGAARGGGPALPGRLPSPGDSVEHARADREDGEDPRSHRRQPLDLTGIDWLIVGGESGPSARPMRLEWARELVAASRAAGVAPFVKQLGAKPVAGHTTRHYLPLQDRKGGDWTEWPVDLRVREMPTVRT